MPQPSTDTELQNLIDVALAGDPSAHELLIHHACDRLLRLTRKMFHDYPRLQRWEQTDDVFQNAMVRLHRALANVPVETVRHFFNLATVQIRRELVDLGRHYYGPEGVGANHHTDHVPQDDAGGTIHDRASRPSDPLGWCAFHDAVEGLPQDDQEIINLIFYEGLTQDEAARILGTSVRTVKRRWAALKYKLHEALNRVGEG